MTDTRWNRIRRVTTQLRELAGITKPINWRMDHGHIVGDTPCFKNNGEPVILSNGRQALLEHDIACEPSSGSGHIVRRAPPYDRSRTALRYMIAAQPKTVLQLIDDYEAMLAEKDDHLATLRAALRDCLGCVEAAEAEGIHETINSLRDSEHFDTADVFRLIDLVERRLMYVRNYAEPALTATAIPTLDSVAPGV